MGVADTVAVIANLPPPDRLWFSFEDRAGGEVRGIAVGTPRSLSITWSPVPSATGYLFEIGSREGADDLGEIRKNAAETSHVIALEPERPIWARVRSVNQEGQSAPSSEIEVTWRDGEPKLPTTPSRQ